MLANLTYFTAFLPESHYVSKLRDKSLIFTFLTCSCLNCQSTQLSSSHKLESALSRVVPVRATAKPAAEQS